MQGRRDRKEKEEEWPDLNFLASRVRQELSSCASIPWLIPNAASKAERETEGAQSVREGRARRK